MVENDKIQRYKDDYGETIITPTPRFLEFGSDSKGFDYRCLFISNHQDVERVISNAFISLCYLNRVGIESIHKDFCGKAERFIKEN